MSGNTDFWHNDQFPQTSLISSGNFLFGADRRIRRFIYPLAKHLAQSSI